MLTPKCNYHTNSTCYFIVGRILLTQINAKLTEKNINNNNFSTQINEIVFIVSLIKLNYLTWSLIFSDWLKGGTPSTNIYI